MANFASTALVKEFLGITASTDDTLIGNILDRTTRMIQQYCGRDLMEATYTDEPYLGDGVSMDLILRQYPLTSITSITEILDLLSGSTLVLTVNLHYKILHSGLSENPGIVRRLDGYWTKARVDNFLVTYVAGFASGSIPKDLVQAEIDWCSYIYKNRDMRVGVSSYRIGSYSVNYKDDANAGDGSGLNLGLPPSEVRMVLDNYKDPRMESTFG